MQHDWIKSTLGHGETMCSRCLITNREAAALGVTGSCDVPPPLPKATNDNANIMPDDGDECPTCGGEGFIFDCFDGCCEDYEIGCDDCTRPCECQKAAAVTSHDSKTIENTGE